MGIALEREVPLLAKQTFRKWLADQEPLKSTLIKDNSICFVMIHNYYDVQVGIDAFELLTALGYKVLVLDHEESGFYL
jgi:Fe-S oxidoreductase